MSGKFNEKNKTTLGFGVRCLDAMRCAALTPRSYTLIKTIVWEEVTDCVAMVVEAAEITARNVQTSYDDMTHI